MEESEARTALAEDRTILANERTFAGWVRTSLTAVGIALGFHALFSAIEPGWVPRAIASTFLAIAVLTVWLAERRAAAVMRRLDPHVVVTARTVNLRLIAWAIIAATGALALTIWFPTGKQQAAGLSDLAGCHAGSAAY